MSYAAAVLLVILVLAPVASVLRRRASVRGRRQATLDLYRAQAVELDRELGEGRISAADHGTALLEVQRRLLAAADAPDVPEGRPSRDTLLAGLVLIPLAAVGLYLIAGRPDLPADPMARRMAEADKRSAQEEAMADQLRTVIAKLDPHSDKARQGEILLGNIEADRGNFAGAADAWRAALAVKFEPLLAVEAADAASRAEGHVSEASAALFRQALASAPPGAPWRAEVEARLSRAQAGTARSE